MHNSPQSGASKDFQIAILGLGHVGLPTALGFAELGWKVIGADEDSERVKQLNESKSPFYEPGLQVLLEKHIASGLFKATDDVSSAIQSSTVLFVCVGTPQRESGEADLTQVEGIARMISRNLNGYKLIVEKSTVPAITAMWIKRTVQRYATAPANGGNGSAAAETHSPASFDVASNPEFLREGQAVENFFHPDRVIVGVETERARDLMESLYRPLNCPIVITDLTTAELIKHAANAFLATKISYINMVSDVCDAVGADVSMVARGLGLDPRIGPDFLSAGIGFGGYCFPKDLKAFIHLAEKHGVECSMLKEVENVNKQRVPVFMKKVNDALWMPQGKTIAIWGLAFKPNTDDIREAPSARIIEALIREGANLRLYDPKAMPQMKRLFPEQPGKITYCLTAYDACEGAQAVAVLTEWDEFRNVDLARVRDLMELPVILDGRNIFDPQTMRKAGIEYVAMGRGGLGFPGFQFPKAPAPVVRGAEYAGTARG